MNILSKRTESIFEIIAGYFVDVHFNTLFVYAKNNHGGSITDSYRKVLNYYLLGTFKDRDKYIHTIKELHKYYVDITHNTMITFADLVNVVVGEFVPEEYFEDLNSRQRDMVLNDVVKRLVTWLNEKCAKDYIKYVIDERAHVRVIQDAARDCLATIRDDYYIKFAAQIKGAAINSKNTVSMEMVEKMKTALVEQVRLKCAAEKERDKLNNLAVDLRERLRKAKKEIKDLEAELAAMGDDGYYEEPVSRHESVSKPVSKPEPISRSESVNESAGESDNEEASAASSFSIWDKETEESEDEEDDELAAQRAMIEKLRARNNE